VHLQPTAKPPNRQTKPTPPAETSDDALLGKRQAPFVIERTKPASFIDVFDLLFKRTRGNTHLEDRSDIFMLTLINRIEPKYYPLVHEMLFQWWEKIKFAQFKREEINWKSISTTQQQQYLFLWIKKMESQPNIKYKTKHVLKKYVKRFFKDFEDDFYEENMAEVDVLIKDFQSRNTRFFLGKTIRCRDTKDLIIKDPYKRWLVQIIMFNKYNLPEFSSRADGRPGLDHNSPGRLFIEGSITEIKEAFKNYELPQNASDVCSLLELSCALYHPKEVTEAFVTTVFTSREIKKSFQVWIQEKFIKDSYEKRLQDYSRLA
jgi:hypothetical protein